MRPVPVGIRFMKRRVKSPSGLEGAIRSSGHTSSERAQPFNQPRSARANESYRCASPSSFFLAKPFSEVTHPFIRAHLGTSCAGAREDPREEQRPLMHGSRKAATRIRALAPPA
jgi:hypothetical protein